MVLVKILGFIDVIAAISFLAMVFSINLPLQIVFALSMLLFLKGLYIFSGNLFSILDFAAGIILILGIFFNPVSGLLWFFSLFLMAKGVASFL